VELRGEVRAARQPVEVVADEGESVAAEVGRRVELAAGGERQAMVQLGRRRGDRDRGCPERGEPAHAASLRSGFGNQIDAQRALVRIALGDVDGAALVARAARRDEVARAAVELLELDPPVLDAGGVDEALENAAHRLLIPDGATLERRSSCLLGAVRS